MKSYVHSEYGHNNIDCSSSPFGIRLLWDQLAEFPGETCPSNQKTKCHLSAAGAGPARQGHIARSPCPDILCNILLLPGLEQVCGPTLVVSAVGHVILITLQHLGLHRFEPPPSESRFEIPLSYTTLQLGGPFTLQWQLQLWSVAGILGLCYGVIKGVTSDHSVDRTTGPPNTTNPKGLNNPDRARTGPEI